MYPVSFPCGLLHDINIFLSEVLPLFWVQTLHILKMKFLSFGEINLEKSECRLGRYQIFSSTIYRQTYIVIFDGIVIVFFSFTHNCFRADNHRYLSFYKHHNKSQIHLHSMHMYVLPKVKKTVLISFPCNFWLFLIAIYFVNCDFPISR